MKYSQYIIAKAKKLVAENRVLQVFWGAVFSIFLVVGKTKSYFVHLRTDGTVACTCAYWERRQRICSHILASQLYHNPPCPEVPEEWDPEQTLAEMKGIVMDTNDSVVSQTET